MKNYFSGFASLALTFLLLGCNTQNKALTDTTAMNTEEKAPVITEKYWKLTELNGRTVMPNENNRREPHMILKTADNRVVGSGGCNTFTGSYELKDPLRISFSKVASTQMACMDMEVEDQFFKVLGIADNYNIVGDTLTLNKARMAPLARFVAVYME